MIKGLLRYLEKGVSPFHTAELAAEEFSRAGFQELSLEGSWQLQKGGCYYVRAFGSSLFAFRVNRAFGYCQGFRIGAAHTDWPCLRLKTAPDWEKEGYAGINAEVYGGPILNTWLDRPLSAAGRVTLRGEGCFKPETRLVDFGRPIFTIPNLAIHVNHDVNKGVELNKQADMAPLAALSGDDKEPFMTALAKELHCRREDILFFELSVYDWEKPALLGLKEEFLSSPRLDNITSVKACVDGLLAGPGRDTGVDMIALFDHEEIGSRTKQGAGSALLTAVMEKICLSFGYTEEDCLNSRLKSFFLSVDVGHGKHPSHPEKSDVTNQVRLNGGVALKAESNQKYATDGEAFGAVRSLCDQYGIPYQLFANRSDVGSGSTLGSIASSFTVMPTAEVGVPLLAMHSARELMGVEDQKALTELLTRFWAEP